MGERGHERHGFRETGAGQIRLAGCPAVIGALLPALYGGLFILMGLEDLTLLFGSGALFVALGAVMFVTRNIDWYAVKRPAAAGAG